MKKAQINSKPVHQNNVFTANFFPFFGCIEKTPAKHGCFQHLQFFPGLVGWFWVFPIETLVQKTETQRITQSECSCTKDLAVTTDIA